MSKKARIIAFYLAQFHPIPENNKWWGKGFTEWTNVGKAQPLFKNHYQPRVPADLGYYDLRMPEAREAQAQMAKEAGVEGFMYWHYWFGKGKRLLERPFNEVLKSGSPDFPFCLGWANHTWKSSTWKGGGDLYINTSGILMEQTYKEEEYADHFNDVLPAFKDPRYIKIDNKPIFLIYDPKAFDVRRFMDRWQELAAQSEIAPIYFIGLASGVADGEPRKILDMGFDAVVTGNSLRAETKIRGSFAYLIRKTINRKCFGITLDKYKYSDIIKNYFTEEDHMERVFPAVIPGWDRSPRAGRRATIYTGATPELFGKHLKEAIKIVSERKSDDHKVIFLRSWNEWAEGNYVEPDLKYGHGFLDTIKKNIFE